MVWSAGLQAKIDAETEGAEFYKPIAIEPEVQRKVIDSLFRVKLLLHLKKRKAFSDQKGFDLMHLTDDDFKHLELLKYIDGEAELEDFKYADKNSVAVKELPGLKLMTLRMKGPHDSIEKSDLDEILTESRKKVEELKSIYGYEVIPTDVRDKGYFRVLASEKKLVHVYLDRKDYTIKDVKLTDKWTYCPVITLPEGKALLDWISFNKYSGNSTD